MDIFDKCRRETYKSWKSMTISCASEKWNSLVDAAIHSNVVQLALDAP